MDTTQKDFEQGKKPDKNQQLDIFLVNNTGKRLTTNQGVEAAVKIHLALFSFFSSQILSDTVDDGIRKSLVPLIVHMHKVV